MTQRQGILFVISAPSGTGKSTLTQMLLKNMTGVEYSVSMTTREQRTGERDGIDYYYVDVETFKHLIADGEFLEHAVVHGNLYGTRTSIVKKALHSGMDIILDIDIQGAQQIRERLHSPQDPLSLKAVFVFIMPPSMKALEMRLRSRSTDSEESICRRMKNAESEMRCAKDYDYVIVNDDVEAAAARLAEIVKVERTRAEGVALRRAK